MKIRIVYLGLLLFVSMLFGCATPQPTNLSFCIEIDSPEDFLFWESRVVKKKGNQFHREFYNPQYGCPVDEVFALIEVLSDGTEKVYTFGHAISNKKVRIFFLRGNKYIANDITKEQSYQFHKDQFR